MYQPSLDCEGISKIDEYGRLALIVLTVPNRFELHRTKEVPSRMILDGSFDLI